MVRILAVADEVDEGLYDGDTLTRIAPHVVLSCGDLPFDYLEYLVTVAGVPLLYVPGNHDPALRAARTAVGEQPRLVGSHQLVLRRSFEDPPGPRGCTNVDGRVASIRGLRVGGLGGSARYREGPNQYTQTEMRRRGRWLRLRARLRGGLDVLVAHAPPAGLGDDDDPAHRGFKAFHRLTAGLRPKLLVHGHIHPYGQDRPDRSLGATVVVNAIPSRVLEVEVA